MRLSKTNGSINALTFMLSYVPIVLFVILFLVALAMAIKCRPIEGLLTAYFRNHLVANGSALRTGQIFAVTFSTVLPVLAVMPSLADWGWL